MKACRLAALCLWLGACASDPSSDAVGDDGSAQMARRPVLPSATSDGAFVSQPVADTLPPSVDSVDATPAPDVVPAADTPPPPPALPAGLSPVEFAGSKYVFVSERKTWDAARAFCRSYGFDLASAAVEATERRWLIAEFLKRGGGAWHVGISRTEGSRWIWVEGRDVTSYESRFDPMGRFEVIYPSGKYCAAMQHLPSAAIQDDYQYVPVACAVEALPFVCEKKGD